MDIRELLVVLRAGRADPCELAVATELARTHRAFVRALCIAEPAPPSLAECYVIGAAAVADVVDRRALEIDRRIEQSHAAFRAGLDQAGADGDWTCLEGADTIEATRHARLTDLVILARPDEGDAEAARLAEAFLIEGGAPCLLVPRDGPADANFSRILIAWNGTPEAKHAIDAALPLLRRADAVELVIVGDPPGTRMHDRADAVQVYLARHGVDAAILRIAAAHNPAVPILARCRSFKAQLLVAGVYGHPPLAEAILGGATRSILHEAPIPVLFAR